MLYAVNIETTSEAMVRELGFKVFFKPLSCGAQELLVDLV